MFDMLTFDELYALHSTLFDQGTRIHRRMIGATGHPVISPFGLEWPVLAAWHSEVGEMQQEVSAELRRRAEEARADA